LDYHNFITLQYAHPRRLWESGVRTIGLLPCSTYVRLTQIYRP